MIPTGDDAFLSGEDAYTIAAKVMEMVDRVKRANKAVPGVIAKWIIEDEDGVRYEVSVKVEPKT